MADQTYMHRYWRTFAVFAVLGVTLLSALIVSSGLGNHLARRHAPLVDAAMLIKVELYRFHLLMEKRASGDLSVDVDEIMGHLEQCEWYARAMLEGGVSAEGYAIVPLEDDALRIKVSGVLADLGVLRTEAMTGLETGVLADVRGGRRLDALVGSVIDASDDVERELWGAIKDNLFYYRMLTGGITVFSVALIVVCGLVLLSYENRKAADFAALSESRASLRESQERFRNLVETTSDWVWEVDRDGVFTYSSPNVRELLGYAPEEVVGMKVFDLMPGDEAERIRNIFREAVADRAPIRQVENTLVRKDWHTVVMETSGTPFFSPEGELSGYRGIDRDITGKKEMENRKAEFFAMVRHDMKSPLAVIQGYADLLLSDKASMLDEEARGIIGQVRSAGRKLADMLDDFKAVSDLEDSGFSPDRAPVDVSGMLVELGASYSALARMKGLSFETKLPEGLPVVPLDSAYVERAVSNMLQNAVNYTPKGGAVRLEACVSYGDGPGMLEISVSDDGPGIPAGEIGRVFERHFRASNTKGARGSGLGLAIVKAVAEAHGGSVELETEEGRGSTFRMLLPVVEPAWHAGQHHIS